MSLYRRDGRAKPVSIIACKEPAEEARVIACDAGSPVARTQVGATRARCRAAGFTQARAG